MLASILFCLPTSPMCGPHRSTGVLSDWKSHRSAPIEHQPESCEYMWDDGFLRGAYYYLNEEDVIASRFVSGAECDFDTVYISEIAVRILIPDDYPPHGWPDRGADPLRIAVWVDMDKDSIPDGFPIFTDTTVRFSIGWAYIFPPSLVSVKKDISFWVGVTNLDGGGAEGICVDSFTDYPECKWAREAGVWLNQDYYPGDHMIRAYLAGNNYPSLAHPGNRQVDEGENVHFSLSVIDPDEDSISIYSIDAPPGASFQDSVFDWTPNSCQSGEHEITFVALDNGTPALTDTVKVLLTVNNLNRSPTVGFQPPSPVWYGGNPVEVEVTLADSDWTECHDDTLYLSLVGLGTLVDNCDGTAHYSWNTTASDTGTYVVSFIATDQHGVSDTANCQITVEAPPFKLSMKTLHAYPAQEGLLFPVLLSNSDSLSAFQALIQYDLTAVEIVTVVTPDSVYIEPPAPDSGWYYAPYAYPPEYFSVIPGPGGHSDRVQIIGIMDMDMAPVTPPIPPGDEQLMFCLVLDVLSSAAGHTALFAFRTYDCSDNTLAGTNGYTLWGPTVEFTPAWVCPERADSLRGVTLQFGSAAIQEILVGDLNLNGIACEIGDAVVFINYLKYGTSSLVSPTVQTPASDINGDQIYWNISDLVMLLNIINETPKSSPLLSMEPVAVRFIPDGSDRVAVEVESDVPIGGAFFNFKYDRDIVEFKSPGFAFDTDMILESYITEDELRVLIFSWHGEEVPAGKRVLFTMAVNCLSSPRRMDTGGLFEINEISFSDAFGNALDINISAHSRFEEPSSVAGVTRNFPNPFDNRTSVLLTLPECTQVKLEIFDSTGRLVKVLVDGKLAPGNHRVEWNGEDEQGNTVPSGVYFSKTLIGSFNKVGKMLLLRGGVHP